MSRPRCLALCTAVLLCCPALRAADWPQFRYDAMRSGYTPEALSAGLSPQWSYRPAQPPDPAWLGLDTRLPFDHAPQVVVAGGLVLFGSSADCCLRALDAASGEERWRVFSDAPFRFAPVVWERRVFAAGDDGMLHCLNLGDGGVLWRKRIAPGDDWVLGNGRLISRWPARGGPVIHDGILYVAAGIWPSEGIVVQALDAATGDLLWENDAAGYIEMDQPHPTARAKSGISAQGYLTVAGEALLIPTGRATPASLSRSDGALRYFRLQEYSGRGAGPYISTVGEWYFSELDAFRVHDGQRFSRGIPSEAMAATPGTIVYATPGSLAGIAPTRIFVEEQGVDRRGNPVPKFMPGKPDWTVDCPGPRGRCLIAAADTAVVGIPGDATTGPDRVVLIDIASRQVTGSFEVEGVPLGLAAADGRLYVSTDRGVIHCFGMGGGAPAAVVGGTPPRPDPATGTVYARAAEEILRTTRVEKGYCVDVDCGDGGLAREIALRSELRVIALAGDAASVAAARETLTSQGLYGTRVTVLQRDPTDTRLPNSLANLIVSGRSVLVGRAPAGDELQRLQRPYGGAICLGKPGEMSVALSGPPPGAGEWTHQYAAPGNPGASEDELVRGPLGVLWFADNTFEMPSRHGRGPSPLFADGRLFVEGIDGLRAIDAYNGTILWDYPIPGVLKAYDQEHLNGVAITGSNICIADGSLYARVDNRCLRLDAATGELVSTFVAPAGPDGETHDWGYIACAGGLLFGSLYNEAHQVQFAYGTSDMSGLFSESLLLFAMDAETGELRWTHTPKASVRNNTLAVGAGRVFFIDRPIAVRDRRKGDDTEHPPGTLHCLDAATGEEVWSVAEGIYGTMLALSQEHEVLLMSYQHTNFRLSSELGGRLAAFRASDGAPLWDIQAAYVSRPLINDRTIYAQPGAWDLLTGTRLDFNFSRSYGCGTIAGSRHLLAYRSATLGYRDLTRDLGTENYGGIRPGCWINALPVGGLLLLPEASQRCICSYLIKATCALQPYGVRAPRIQPPSASSGRPITVQLLPDDPTHRVHYTLDGSSPKASSAICDGPLTISRSATVNARVIHDGVPGPISTGHFTVDPDILKLDGPAWRVHDTPGAGPPQSKWVVSAGIVAEMSNHYKGEAADESADTDRPGTYREYLPAAGASDGELSFEIASDDDDGLGVAVRFADPQHHYLWAMDRQRSFRILARKSGEQYKVLARNAKGFAPGRWYGVRILLRGARIAVFVDGEPEFDLVDEALPAGGFALYSWGSTGAKFRNLKWRPAG